MREGESQDKRLGELSKAARQPGDNIGSHTGDNIHTVDNIGSHRVDIIARGQHRQPRDNIGSHTGYNLGRGTT